MFIKINDKKYDLLFYEESIEDINGEMTNPEIMQILYLQMEINYNDNLVELRNIIKNQMKSDNNKIRIYTSDNEFVEYENAYIRFVRRQFNTVEQIFKNTEINIKVYIRSTKYK